MGSGDGDGRPGGLGGGICNRGTLRPIGSTVSANTTGSWGSGLPGQSGADGDDGGICEILAHNHRLQEPYHHQQHSDRGRPDFYGTLTSHSAAT